MFFALFGMTFSIVLNELRLNQEISLDNEYIVLCYIAFSNLALAITAYFRYDQYLKWYVKRGLLTQYDTLGSTGWWKAIVIEQFIALIAPFPFFQGIKYVEENPNWKVTISYEMNQVLMCFSFVRLYIVLRFILLISKFMNPRSIRVCVINGCSANHMFAMKAFMK